tara:strand:- start:64 stop:255 length:192 start_codon:yes stop_codon:yes gene_type:complete
MSRKIIYTIQEYNLAPSSYNMARDIWESESLNDDLDFYVPEFKSNRRKNLKWNKARYFGIKKL